MLRAIPPFALHLLPKNVGLFLRNVGLFPKNVGDFPKNVGLFSEMLRGFTKRDALTHFLCRNDEPLPPYSSTKKFIKTP